MNIHQMALCLSKQSDGIGQFLSSLNDTNCTHSMIDMIKKLASNLFMLSSCITSNASSVPVLISNSNALISDLKKSNITGRNLPCIQELQDAGIKTFGNLLDSISGIIKEYDGLVVDKHKGITNIEGNKLRLR